MCVCRHQHPCGYPGQAARSSSEYQGVPSFNKGCGAALSFFSSRSRCFLNVDTDADPDPALYNCGVTSKYNHEEFAVIDLHT